MTTEQTKRRPRSTAMFEAWARRNAPRLDLRQSTTGPSDDGPEFGDGCDHEGFAGGCSRAGHTVEECPNRDSYLSGYMNSETQIAYLAFRGAMEALYEEEEASRSKSESSPGLHAQLMGLVRDVWKEATGKTVNDTTAARLIDFAMHAPGPAGPALPSCDDLLFRDGVSVGLFDIPLFAAEEITKGIAKATGALVDWHYVAGRVHIKALPAPDKRSAGPEGITDIQNPHRHPLALYAESYEMMARIARREGRAPSVSPTSVAVDIRRNMIPATIAAHPQTRADSVELPQVALPPRPDPVYRAGVALTQADVDCDCYSGADVLAYGRECAEAQRKEDHDVLARNIGWQAQTWHQPYGTQANLTDDAIRRVLLANGYEIKPGNDDLKPYVYAAARELLRTYALSRMPTPLGYVYSLPDGKSSFFSAARVPAISNKWVETEVFLGPDLSPSLASDALSAILWSERRLPPHYKDAGGNVPCMERVKERLRQHAGAPDETEF